MILIDALFINKGGGAVLLRYLIERVLAHPQKERFFFILDKRFDKPAALTDNYVVLNNSLVERLRYYRKRKKDFAKVFCFANTPPPVKLKVPAYTYLHNQKLLDAPKHKFRKSNLAQYLKYLAIRLYNHNTDFYIVQTPHMAAELASLKLKDAAHCLTIPFYDDGKYGKGYPPFEEREKDSFVFISNPSPQKNYPTLLDAWEHLLDEGRKPLLHVTIDNTAPHLIARVHKLNERGARIHNHEYLDPRELYYTCRYLIFPSVMESFGLPLIEAADSGMKILASELPYVYDVVTPSLTFNPMNKVSIKDAVCKALSEELPFPKIATCNEVERLIALLCA